MTNDRYLINKSCNQAAPYMSLFTQDNTGKHLLSPLINRESLFILKGAPF